MTIKRIGFACKWIDTEKQIDGISAKDPARLLSTSTTTLAWLNRQSKTVAYDKLEQIVAHNLESIYRLVERVAQQPQGQRMVRLSSEVLPLYTEKTYGVFYRHSHMQEMLETHFARVGDLARAHNVRLSFHPGQFTVLASDRPSVVENSINEFEYHARMAEMMGYGRKFQDMKINVHVSGKLGPEGIRRVYPRLSTAAQNCITIENEENNYGLDRVLELADIIPIVFDVHHEWIHSGEYVMLDDPRIERIVASWRGVRPVMHYSQSPEELLYASCSNTVPDMDTLLNAGHKRAKLRAHSDFFWNKSLNRYVLEFLDRFDIMCESKAKNLASVQLFSEHVANCQSNIKEVNA
jgi:UV DNA damage endonuclease